MGRNSGTRTIIVRAMLVASALGTGFASPPVAMAQPIGAPESGQTDPEKSDLPQSELGAIIPGEFIVQLEPTQGDGAPDGSLSAHDVDRGALRDRVDQVMGAVAQHATADGYGVDATTDARDDDSNSVTTNSVTTELASIYGFAATLTPEAAEFVRGLDGVKAIYPDMELDGSGGSTTDLSNSATPTSWALDRIDQADLPLDGTYRPPATGAGSNIYFVGSGFWADHEQFAGRVGDGVNLVTNEEPGELKPSCFAPGTHAASIAAGATLGAATAPTLHSVRILKCNQKSTFGLALAALDWVAAHAPARSVVYFSAVDDYYAPLNDAIGYLDRLGITTVVPGRPGDACALSPTSAPEALTVGASTEQDRTAGFSTSGRCVDLFAPGTNVPAAGVSSPSATTTLSGHDMPAALAAGAVAMYLEQHPDDSPAQARAAVVAAAVADRLQTADVLAPNRLLNIVKMEQVAVPAPRPTPTAHIVQPIGALVDQPIVFDGSQSRDSAGGKNLTYAWRRSDADGVVSTDPTMTVTYEQGSQYTVTLTVTDANGVSATTFISVWVMTQPFSDFPELIFTPSTNQSVAHSTTIEFDASQSYDPDGGDLRTTWVIVKPDGSKEIFKGPKLSYTFAGQPDGSSVYEVQVSVTDDEGGSAARAIRVTVASSAGAPASGEAIPNQFIVELAEPGEITGRDLHDRVVSVMARIDDLGASTAIGQQLASEVLSELESINGFSANLDAASVAALEAMPEVRAVYPNRVYRTQGVSTTGLHPNTARPTTSWGLDRIDQADLPGDGSFNPPNNGAGVHIYVVDQGIWPDHSEFAGRIGDGVDVFGGATDTSCFLHGTHVAGIAAGKTVGVANEATLHSVRVLGCDGVGTTATVLSGIDWIADHLQKPAVVNFSLGGGYDEATNAGVNYLASRGATVTTAAGNADADACAVSPAGGSEAITVAASYDDDDSYWSSNWGRCVELYAPGAYITSAAVSGPGDYVEYSGTSMAAPFVAGAAAVYLNRFPDATPAQVSDALQRGATPDRIHNVWGDSPNLLLDISALPAPDPEVMSSLPVAHVTTTGNAVVGSELSFDGATSSSPDGGALSFEWRVSDDGRVAGTGQSMAHTFETAGRYRVGLRVTNGAGDSSWTTTIVDVIAAPPVVILKPDVDQSVTVGSSLTFDGSESKAADGGAVKFAWLTTGRGVASRDATYTRSFDDVGRVGIELVVTDGKGTVARKHVNVWVSKPQDPVVVMNPDVDQHLMVGSSLTFDGSNSNDPDGGALKYAWKTTGVIGVASRDAKYTREFPKQGRFGIELTVIDDEGQQATKHINVWVAKPREPSAVMKPGVDQRITAGSSLTFDGSASEDPDGGALKYAWKTTGEGVVSRKSTYTRKFPRPGRVGVELIVTDNEGKRARTHINVWVSAAKPRDPIADFDPGVDQTVKVGSSLTFDGSASKDPDGGQLKFAWRMTGAGLVSQTSKYRTAFSRPGRFGIELTVTDDEGKQAKKHINVWVT